MIKGSKVLSVSAFVVECRLDTDVSSSKNSGNFIVVVGAGELCPSVALVARLSDAFRRPFVRRLVIAR